MVSVIVNDDDIVARASELEAACGRLEAAQGSRALLKADAAAFGHDKRGQGITHIMCARQPHLQRAQFPVAARDNGAD